MPLIGPIWFILSVQIRPQTAQGTRPQEERGPVDNDGTDLDPPKLKRKK